jgi:hypothetical protein
VWQLLKHPLSEPFFGVGKVMHWTLTLLYHQLRFDTLDCVDFVYLKPEVV